MTIRESVAIMRSVVNAYDSFQSEKQKIRDKADRIKKGAGEMKIGRVICITVGIVLLIAASAAAAYCFFKGCPFCGHKKSGNEDLYDDFPKEADDEKPSADTVEETASEE